jgi:hypothetical protein
MPIVFLKSVPDGFYEDQMRDYFTQFGTVRNVRLWRSKKVCAMRAFRSSLARFVDGQIEGHCMGRVCRHKCRHYSRTNDGQLFGVWQAHEMCVRAFLHASLSCAGRLLRATQVPPQLFDRRFTRPPRPHASAERAARNQNAAAPSTLSRQRKRHNRTVKARVEKLAALGVVYDDGGVSTDVVKKADDDDDVKVEDAIKVSAATHTHLYEWCAVASGSGFFVPFVAECV